MNRMDSFRGGIHPLRRTGAGKGMTEDKPIQKLSPPKIAIIPMTQSAGTTCDPLIKKGDRVLLGQKIGEPRGFVGAPVHSSVSGKVLSLEQREIMSGVFCICALIESDGLDERAQPLPIVPLDAQPEQIVSAIREAGIVGMGGAAFPTQIKLSPPPDKVVDTVIINGAECEPYLNSDNRVMIERGQRVLDGALYIMRALGAQRCYIAVEKNKPAAIEAMQKLVGESDNISVKALRTKYPQGSEKQLIRAITSRQVPSRALPADVGCVVINAATSAAIADALTEGLALTERVITVSGQVKDPQNLSVRIGTPVSDLIEHCGGLLEDAARVLSGGPMMGVALFDLGVPVTKSTSGITVLGEQQLRFGAQTACIHCGRCSAVCPMRLMPMKLRNAAWRQSWDEAQALHALDCMECGSCSYVCPAKIEVLSHIKIAKRTLLAKSKR